MSKKLKFSRVFVFYTFADLLKCMCVYTIQADTSPEGGRGALSYELASSAEHATWLQRSLECCKQLGQWEDVRNATLYSIAKDEDPNTLWQDARTKDWAIPCYLDALLQVPQFHDELRSFTDNALKVLIRTV